MTTNTKILLGVLGIIFLSATAVVAKKVLNVPRGIRNNNPGNLRDTTIAWQGEVPAGKKQDKVFEEFTEMKYGVRALIMDIQSDLKKGLVTIHDLISAFAPSSENNTKKYIEFVVKHTGFVEYQTLKNTKAFLFPLTKAIARYETGKDIITEDLFDQAFALI